MSLDRVNHDKLMSEVSKRVQDRRVWTLIRRFLKAGAMEHEALHETVEGVPQGGPLSPLLSNLLLDRLDREVERRGHRCVRYADDSNVYVRSKRAGHRGFKSLSQCLSTRLKLKVNEAKSAVGRPWERTFRGFRFTGRSFRRCISPEAVKRLKERVREITRRTRGRRIARVAQELRRYLPGWKADYEYAEVRSISKAWDSWMRRRLRGSLWKPWGQRGYKALRKRGVSRDLAWNTAKPAHGPWRLSRSPALAMALPGSHFDGLGVPRRSIKGSSPPNRRGT
jgi:RNA-directed DNA polymerase